MKAQPRMLAMTFGAAVAAVGLLPAAQAAAAVNPTVAVQGNLTYEYENRCQDVAPFTCTVRPGSIALYVAVYNRPTPPSPITVSWRIQDVSTTAGQDYTGPTSGTVTIPTNSNFALAVTVPVADDGVAESYEYFQGRVVSSSLPNANFQHGRGEIYDGGRIPRDCVETRPSYDQRSLTCSNRPAGQRWQIVLDCFHPWALNEFFYGNIVTGNGRSDTSCDSADSWRPGLAAFRAVP